ncbi:ATP-grasp fold amidoligase family protein [Clostridium sp. VAP41]|uniref:ATP-grasp fold amidoligase family protein n=1 Tax=Clostridium sp. VAP41 TaxID=2949979 RepID=UPI002079271F|nr:ATP-grasp fold amidoligase family protein [Clostridium sp. VAP41]
MNELLRRRLKCLYTRMLCLHTITPLLYADYFRSYHKILNLKNPDTVGAKIQWIKKYGQLERYTDLVDKYKVMEYITKEIGDKYLPKVYGVFNNSSEIEFNNLPEKFVLKCNHGSGEVYICKDKKNITQSEWKQTLEKLAEWLSTNFYEVTRERQYKDIERKIICEEYLEDDSGSLRDYKIYCFNGKPEYISVNVNPHTPELTIDYFNLDWKKCDEFNCVGEKNSFIPIKKPDNLKEMINIAKILSQKFSYVRVDLRSVEGKTYFGELTFTSSNGTCPFKNQEKEKEIAKLIDLKNYH